MNRHFGGALVVMSLLVTPATGQTASGTAAGTAQSSIGVIGEALLQSFRFNWIGYDDHHIKTIQVQPQTYNNTIKVGYYDKNFDDKYRWRVRVRSFSDARVRDGRERGRCRGRCVRNIYIPKGYVFVLSGFRLTYAKGDHHIDEIGIWERRGKLTVAFNDKNNDDLFDYDVEYVLLPVKAFKRLKSNRGSSAGYASTTIPRGRGVLRGFWVDYQKGDHEIHTFGVQLNPSSLRVDYRDKNGDDRFRWMVDWGHL